MSLHLLLIGALAAFTFCGCRSTKGSASIYQGNAPSIHYYDAESAGGPMKTTHYR